MIKPTLRTALCLLSLLFFKPAFSQADDDQTAMVKDLQSRIDSLESRINAIEEKKSTWQKISEKLPTFSGYLQTGYNYNSVGEGTSTFQVKRLRLILSGNPLPKFSYRVQLEAFNGVNIGGRWEKQRIVQFLDAYIDYSFLDAFKIRVGQFSTPVGYENYNISPLTNVTIDYAPICSRMVLRNAVGYNYSDYGRDIGLMFMGDLLPADEKSYYRLSYNLALTNGHLPSTNDNNKSKDVIAALTFRPIKFLNIKLAYNWGQYTPDTFSGNIDSDNYPWNVVKGDKYIPMNRFVAGVWYDDPHGLYVRSEYGKLSGRKHGTRLVDEDCFYVLAAYQWRKWVPVVRFDWYRDSVNPNLLDNRSRGLIGCTFIANRHIKVQANYLLSHYTETAALASNNGRRYSNEFLLMGLFSF